MRSVAPSHSPEDAGTVDEPRSPGLADLDAAASSTWLRSTGLWIGLLPVLLCLTLVVVALLA